MTRSTRLAARVALVLAAALCSTALSSAGQVAAMTRPVNFACQAAGAGQSVNLGIELTVNGSAPSVVSAGKTFTIVLTPQPMTIPDSVAGQSVDSIQNFVLVVPIPANAGFVSARVSGGFGLNSTPVVAKMGDTVVMTVAGPAAGGTRIALPAVRLTLTAGHSGVITSTLGGTSYANPGLTFDATVSIVAFTIQGSVSCYPRPNPILTSTVIR